jgi:hypothetical protein
MNVSDGRARQPRLRGLLLAAAVFGAAPWAQATVVTHHYAALGGTAWSVAFAVTNDGLQPAFSGFSVYFDPALFANLALADSPSGWDSIVLQPDTGLPAPGLFDTLALDLADLPAVGATQGGFRVTFDWLGGGAMEPGRLRYTINDENFQVLAEGLTVPEPSSILLASLGLGGLALRRRRESQQRPAAVEVLP